jgi:putative aldouronate transport system permease protein
VKNKQNSNKIALTKGDRVFNVINYLFLSLIFIVTIYPIYYVIVASISNSTYVNSGQLLLLPKGMHFTGYQHVFSDSRIRTGYMNTIFYTVCGTALGLFSSLLAGYAL